MSLGLARSGCASRCGNVLVCFGTALLVISKAIWRVADGCVSDFWSEMICYQTVVLAISEVVRFVRDYYFVSKLLCRQFLKWSDLLEMIC